MNVYMTQHVLPCAGPGAPRLHRTQALAERWRTEIAQMGWSLYFRNEPEPPLDQIAKIYFERRKPHGEYFTISREWVEQGDTANVSPAETSQN
jgi:hypothetical protein